MCVSSGQQVNDLKRFIFYNNLKEILYVNEFNSVVNFNHRSNIIERETEIIKKQKKTI